MEAFQLDDVFETEIQPKRATRSKPIKHKWREIETLKEKRALQKQLSELDILGSYDLKDLDL